jgi:hypothetical protein
MLPLSSTIGRGYLLWKSILLTPLVKVKQILTSNNLSRKTTNYLSTLNFLMRSNRTPSWKLSEATICLGMLSPKWLFDFKLLPIIQDPVLMTPLCEACLPEVISQFDVVDKQRFVTSSTLTPVISLPKNQTYSEPQLVVDFSEHRFSNW